MRVGFSVDGENDLMSAVVNPHVKLNNALALRAATTEKRQKRKNGTKGTQTNERWEMEREAYRSREAEP